MRMLYFTALPKPKLEPVVISKEDELEEFVKKNTDTMTKNPEKPKKRKLVQIAAPKLTNVNMLHFELFEVTLFCSHCFSHVHTYSIFVYCSTYSQTRTTKIYQPRDLFKQLIQ